MHEVGGAVECEGGKLARPAQCQRGRRNQHLNLCLIAEALRGEGHTQLRGQAGGSDLPLIPQEHAPARQPRTARPGDGPPVRRETDVDSITLCGLRCDQSRDLCQPHGQDVSRQLDSLIDSITNKPRSVGVLRAGKQRQQGVVHDSD